MTTRTIDHERVAALRTKFEEFLRECDRASAEEVKAAFGSLHRTEQQMFVREAILPVFEQLADDHDKGYVDLRNEGSAKWAKAAIKVRDEERIGLPLV